MLKRILTTLLALCAAAHLPAETQPETPPAPSAPLSAEATISLLTSGPSDMAIFTAWGHTAIRVKDPATSTDKIYNYGIFSFGEPLSFVARFVSGQTDYRLGRTSMHNSIEETIEKNADYYEQELNLTQKEKERLYGALLENYKPENRVYRYKYFSDNCATRPRQLLKGCIDGRLELDTTGAYSSLYKKDFLNADGSQKSYRDIIYELLRTSPWYTFGIDLCLGQPTDKRLTGWDDLFLPVVLKDEASLQKIVAGDSARALVKQTNQLLEKAPEGETAAWTSAARPQTAFWALALLTLLHALYYNTKHKDDRWAYAGYYGIMGLLGTIVFYVSCLSVHEFVFPNYNLLWLNPLHLLIALLAYSKRAARLETALIGATAAGCLCAIAYYAASKTTTAELQRYNAANLPLIITQLIMAGSWLKRAKEAKKKA